MFVADRFSYSDLAVTERTAIALTFLSAGQQHDGAEVEDIGMPYFGASAASL